MAVRPFQISDIPQVNALHEDIGWNAPTQAQWQWLSDNPARGDAPIGWVIDTDGRIDGFLGSFRLKYNRGSSTFTSATSFSVIVSPRAKGAIRELIIPFLAQKDPFAITILNANEIGSPVYRRYGVKPFRSPLHDVKLSWIIGPTLALIAKGMRHAAERFPALYSLLGEQFTPNASAFFDARRIRWPKGVFVIEDFSDNSALGQFWKDLKGESNLVVDRSPATLRWRLSIPDHAIPPLVLGYHDEKGLCAYAIAQLSKTGPLDIASLEIIDIITLERAPASAVPTLIKALKHASLKMDALKLRLPLVSPKLLELLGPKARTAHKEGGWGHAFVHFNAPEGEFEDWNPTPLEGSYSFTLRQPRLNPHRQKRSRVQRLVAASEN